MVVEVGRSEVDHIPGCSLSGPSSVVLETFQPRVGIV